MKFLGSFGALFFCALSAPAGAGENLAPLPAVEHSVTVPSPVQTAWQTWTSAGGLQTFLAEGVVLEPKVGGYFRVDFFPANPEGMRGTEDLTVLAIEPEKRFAFTWDAPPNWPEIRAQRTFAEVIFEAEGPAKTRLTFRQMGWGSGKDWVAVREYFDGAWRQILARYEYSLENGPIDWGNVPDHLWFRANENQE